MTSISLLGPFYFYPMRWPDDGRAPARPPLMQLRQVEAPINPLLTLSQAYQQLRLDPDFGTSPPSRTDDEMIMDAVAAANGEIDGFEAWLGRALITQTWELSMMTFPGRAPIALPLPPLQAVLSVSYLDNDGVRQQLTDVASSPPGDGFRVGTEGVVAYVAPPYNANWPTAVRREGGSVVIRYRCGYGDDGSDVPALIRQYAKARLGHYYANPEMIITGGQAVEVPGYASILENLRVRGVFRTS